MKIHLAVLFGGRSVEHEVAVISAVQAMHAVNREKYTLVPIYITKDGAMLTGDRLTDIAAFRDMPKLVKESEPITLLRENGRVVARFLNQKTFHKKADLPIDVVLPVVHGTNCEDGTIAGLLEYLNVPYVGCDVLSAAVGMDKAVFKDVLKSAGLPVLPCVRFYAREYAERHDEISAKINAEIGFPLIVKPVNLGSSVGITKVKSAADFEDAVALAFSFADHVLVERAVENLREINCSVLGDVDECMAGVCEEPLTAGDILSYDDKYGNAEKSGAKGMASLGRKIPAELSPEKTAEIQQLSCAIFKAIGASGVVRIDFIIDTATDTVYANEINTIPGSLAFYLWEASGVSYPQLIDRLVELAFRRRRKRENLTFTIPTNILSGVSFGTKGSKGAKL